jgi:hypothetical protein
MARKRNIAKKLSTTLTSRCAPCAMGAHLGHIIELLGCIVLLVRVELGRIKLLVRIELRAHGVCVRVCVWGGEYALSAMLTNTRHKRTHTCTQVSQLGCCSGVAGVAQVIT